MKITYLSPLIIVLLFFTLNALAQTSPPDNTDKNEKEASFKFGFNYVSNNVFMGRADTVRTSIIAPDIKYTFKNGIYISGNIDIIPNRTQNKLDAGGLIFGYNYDITDDLDGGVSFSKLFYNPNSTQISSAISSTINANLNYDISGIITPSLSADYNIIKQGFGNDIFINAGLTHDFAKKGIFTDYDLFIISPTAAVNMGTQNFYDAYLTVKKYRLTVKGQAKGTAAQKLIAAQKLKLSKFNLLDYEFSVPIEYKSGPLILSFIPTYAIAQNKLPPRISSGFVATPGVLYFEVGASLKF